MKTPFLLYTETTFQYTTIFVNVITYIKPFNLLKAYMKAAQKVQP